MLQLDELEPLEIGHDLMLPLRRLLGLRAFGLNAFTARGAGDQLIGVHDELGAYAGGHEEVYVVLGGRATLTADEQEFDAPPGTVFSVRDPTVRRGVVAREEGTTVLVIGGPVGEAYRPGAWEYGYVATGLSAKGDHPAADAVLAEGLQQHPDSAHLHYNRACFAALAGDREAALGHLAKAFTLDAERAAAWSAHDTDLDSLRDDPRFPATPPPGA